PELDEYRRRRRVPARANGFGGPACVGNRPEQAGNSVRLFERTSAPPISCRRAATDGDRLSGLRWRPRAGGEEQDATGCPDGCNQRRRVCRADARGLSRIVATALCRRKHTFRQTKHWYADRAASLQRLLLFQQSIPRAVEGPPF